MIFAVPSLLSPDEKCPVLPEPSERNSLARVYRVKVMRPEW